LKNEMDDVKRIPRWAIFISGRGSNFCAAIDEMGDQIELVVTTSAKAAGVLRAKRSGLRCLQISRPINWGALTAELKKCQINKIFLLGFMKILPAEFINEWPEKIVNLHPSLLPLYPGLESIKRAFKERSDIGVSVHEVTAQVDAGKILLQKTSIMAENISRLKPDHGFEQRLEAVELKVHQDEQCLVRKIIGR